MKRISILGACLALLALPYAGVAQAASDSVSPTGSAGPIIAPSISVGMVLAGVQPGAWTTIDVRASASATRHAVITGAVTGLAIGALALTVRDLAHGDRQGRSLGTDAAIVVSAGLVGALVNYVRVRATSGPGEAPTR